MSSLENFLASQKQAGTFVSQGAFAVDFERALKKRASYALPQPELWILRFLQAAFRLEAQRVDIFQERHALIATVSLKHSLPPELSFTDLFRLSNEDDPRVPLQDAVWGAIRKGFAIELRWTQSGSLTALRICCETVEVDKAVATEEQPFFSMKVVPAKPVGILARLFKKADFSGEFFTIAQRGFLVPFPLHLDNQPYDFEQQWCKDFLRFGEIRAARAKAGPRIASSIHHGFEVRFTGKEIKGLPELIEEEDNYDYLYLMCVSWNPEAPKKPSVNWILDGCVVDDSEFTQIESPLNLKLYFPAEDLQTDLGKLHLVECPAKQERLDQLLLYAYFCLLTTPLKRGLLSHRHTFRLEVLEDEIEKLFRPILKMKGLVNKDLVQFENAVKVFRSEKVRQKENAASLNDLQLRQQAELSKLKSLERWSRFMTYKPTEELTTLNLLIQKKKSLEDFFGDYYVRLPQKRLQS